MGTWPLWIAFNAVIALFLVLDLGVFHRRPRVISMRGAAVESAVWISLSLGFGAWVYFAHGPGPGLEFFTGYVVEKSLSTDNVFVFLLVFQYFGVEPKYQHRLLYWGVLGAIVLRGAMIAAGAVLIARFDWILYVFGAFLLYSGFQLFGADHAVHPEKNPAVRWARKFLPMSTEEPTGAIFVRHGGHWLFTSFFLVVIVLETTDLVFALDSIAAVFGVTRDPFIVYTSNICAILGLRALYFLLAGILQYFQYLDEGLALAVMFIGGKLLAAPWVPISTGLSLVIVAGIIGLAILISILRARPREKPMPPKVVKRSTYAGDLKVTPELIEGLAHNDPAERALAANRLFGAGLARASRSFENWEDDEAFRALVVREKTETRLPGELTDARLTVGLAVFPDTFAEIRAANGNVPLADAPADQDVLEFELEFLNSGIPFVHLDILTTKAPRGSGAIARFLEKFGEDIQQVELDVTDVDRATEILRTRFNIAPVYPATRPGANGTRVNFFLVPGANNQKVLVELVEHPKGVRQSPVASH